MRKITGLKVILFLLAFIVSAPTSSYAETLKGKIARDTTISGDILISADVVVEKDAKLVIKPGSNITFGGGSIEVYGTLLAEGTEESPINFTGTANSNNQINGVMVLNSKKTSSKISYCNFSKLNTAVTIINSSVHIEDSSFSNNKIAIDAKQNDESVIKNNKIDSCRRVGIFCKSGSKAMIIGNKISGIKKFGIYIYRSGDVKVIDNEIVSCNNGVMVGFVGSDPEITGNTLKSNKTGILVEKGANPTISHNTIYNNRSGISVSKRSDPRIVSNDIINNKRGIFITFSSYPIIEKNNLIDNEHSIYLEFQSAQWEKVKGDSIKRGGKKYPGGNMPKSAFAGRADSEEFVTPKKNLSDKVSARNNFWGDDVTTEMESRASKDISAIYDFFDAMEFIEDGKKYKLDQVDYSSWSKTRFEDKR